MFTDNPHNDAIVHINGQDKLHEPVPTEECEVCLNRTEDFRLAPGGIAYWNGKPCKGSYCCVDCLGSGKAREFYSDYHTEEELNAYFQNLKLA